MLVKIRRNTDGKTFFATKIEFSTCGNTFVWCRHWAGKHRHGFDCEVIGFEKRTRPVKCNYTADREIYDTTGHYDHTVKVCSSCGDQERK